MNRQNFIDSFYETIMLVEQKFPRQSFSNLNSKILPDNGVYFFFEPTELRKNKTDRIVRIGTHGVRVGSKTTLYNRMYNHKGSKEFGGNHRGSVFRKLIGQAIINRDKLNYPDWEYKKRIDKVVTRFEKPHEITVSKYLHSFTFIVLEVPGVSSKDNDRAFIEANSIGLLSNFNKEPIDSCSENWLGKFTKDNKVIKSGLWNSKDVDLQRVDEKLIDKVQYYLATMKKYY